MNQENVITTTKLKLKQTEKPNINPAFRYLGIPTSWFNRQNIKLPSRNTSAFFIGTGSIITLYFYDRYQSKKIKERYLNQVKYLSESLVSTSDDLSNSNPVAWMPRKVNVYGARIPEDVDVDRGTQWFKRYVKPIIVASAIDYTIHNGTTPGALARKISDDIRDQRLILAAQQKHPSFNDLESSLKPGMPGYREWYAEQHKIEGGSLILGRTTLKEYLWGLKDGYKRKIPIDKLDDDERFSKQLEDAGIFDTPTPSPDDGPLEQPQRFDASGNKQEETLSDQPDNHLDQLSNFSSDKTRSSWNVFNLFSNDSKTANYPNFSSSSTLNQSSLINTTEILEPTCIPPQPPLLLVAFDHPIGIRWWPLKIYRFFNQRYEVELGAKTAMKLIDSSTRPIEPPKYEKVGILNHDQDSSSSFITESLKINKVEDLRVCDDEISLTGSQDLDFLAPSADLHLRRSYRKAAKKIIEERANFRNELKNRLTLARKRAENDNENSVDPNERNESQLRLEAFQKEKKWNDQLKAWYIVRRGSGISWDSDMAQALKIFDHQDSSHDDFHQQPSEMK